MTEPDWLAERFEMNRTRLRAVAYRMLGSPGPQQCGRDEPRGRGTAG
jgi:hypothetical protein